MKYINRSDKLRVIKRNGSYELFDSERIEIAIKKAMKSPSGVEIRGQAEAISQEIEQWAKIQNRDITIYEIENLVHDKLSERKNYSTARAYESYKSVQNFKRKENTSDKNILGLVGVSDKELIEENSNKNAYLNSTQRDLIAGEVSKDIMLRKLLPTHLAQAHMQGVLHIHDLSNMLQKQTNCELVNYSDMLENGFVLNGKKIDQPNSFQVACTVLSQIMAAVASSTFGGQSADIIHLGKYLRKSHDKNLKTIKQYISDEKLAEEMANDLTQKDLESGIQTLQYQINTLFTTNGQSPFVTLFLHIPDGHEYEKEIAMIIEEILKQRIKGIKNEVGVYVTPSFPKLVMLLQENNIHEDSKYNYILDLATECVSKRFYP